MRSIASGVVAGEGLNDEAVVAIAIIVDIALIVVVGDVVGVVVCLTVRPRHMVLLALLVVVLIAGVCGVTLSIAYE